MKGIGSTPPDAFFEQRSWRAIALVVAVFLLFLGRLVELQVVRGKDLAESSQRNSIRSLRVSAPRGEIVDRYGRILATTRLARHLQVVPHEVRRPERTFPLLEQLLEGEDHGFAAAVAERTGRDRFQPLRLAEDLSYEEWAATESVLFAIPGVFTETLPRRFYPNGNVAAHVLGTLGEIGAAQLEEKRFVGYKARDEIGQSGVEALFETSLQGRAGGKNVIVDVAGRIGETINIVEPIPGDRVELTLDLDLQLAAEEAFSPIEHPELRSGAVVALDPRNGDVLVMLSAPAYDPNDFADGIDPKIWKLLNTDPERPLQNRAIAGQYPPGSTYKAIVAAAALQEGKSKPEGGVYCPGHFRLGRRRYRCWKHEGHGPVDLHRAIMQSCDVFFYRAGLDIGIDQLAGHARSFGLGARTGIALAGEEGGLVPTKAWKERRMREPWVRGETVSAAIGQGFNLVTPLQLAVSYAAVANGGTVLVPRLVRARVDREGGLHAGEPVRTSGRVSIDPEHLETVRKGLRAVVMDVEGTGKRSRVEGLDIAGKTGTAQVVRLERVEGLEDDEVPRKYRDHALFAAYAPADDPQIVVVVILEHGRGGGRNAAPIAQRVLDTWWTKHRPEPPVEPGDVRAGAEAPGGAG